MNKLNVIDLFCGAGGLSLGFQQAGFDILVGVDNEQVALETFEFNHKLAVGLNADLSKQETFDLILKTVGDKKIDVIVAGPPCQGFSLTGPRNFDDPRNQLYLAVIEMIKQLKPLGFIIENVPGMANMYKGLIKDEILKRLTDIDYNVDCRILKACDYGVPQMRRRLIFMGVRKDIGKPRFPTPIFGPDTERPYRTCRDAISDLPKRINDLGQNKDGYSGSAKSQYQKMMRGNCSVLYNHVATEHKQFVKETIALVPEGGNYKDLPKGVGESRNFHMAWTRLNGNAPARTVDTGHRNIFHYELNRIPTVRENARLQSFPDDFIFMGTRTSQERQVGNAVPPLLGMALAKELKEIIEKKYSKFLNSIDLFAGCGGLTEGFEQTGKYKMLGAVEWESAPVKELRNHLRNKRNMTDADKRILQFDIQRTEELFNGWDDEKYGASNGLDDLIGSQKIDVIIGGPPCQAYSVAGRIRDEHGMKMDYRNYLFESYLKVVQHYKPKAFVFENVPGILSAKPGDGDVRIIDLIQKSFANAGYAVLGDLSQALIDMTEYGVPQNRKRIVILGLSKEFYGERAESLVKEFYTSYMPEYKVEKKSTVRDAIGDLPKLKPLKTSLTYNGRKLSHELPSPLVNAHVSRYHSKRDIDIFRFLEEDITSGEMKYTDIEYLKKLYTKMTGKISNIHKYYVIRWDEPSNLIPAHLYKDGLRHIHPDPEQARTITVREAARLQTFPDDYEFNCSQTDAFQMIGNAVPPLFARKLANAVYHLIMENREVTL